MFIVADLVSLNRLSITAIQVHAELHKNLFISTCSLQWNIKSTCCWEVCEKGITVKTLMYWINICFICTLELQCVPTTFKVWRLMVCFLLTWQFHSRETYIIWSICNNYADPEVIKPFSCSTQLCMKFQSPIIHNKNAENLATLMPINVELLAF